MAIFLRPASQPASSPEGLDSNIFSIETRFPFSLFQESVITSSFSFLVKINCPKLGEKPVQPLSWLFFFPGGGGFNKIMDPAKLPGIDLSKFPALLPPSGVESNFVNPYSIGPKLTTLSLIFLTLMGLSVSIRFYTKIFIKHSWGLEDCEFSARLY